MHACRVLRPVQQSLVAASTAPGKLVWGLKHCSGATTTNSSPAESMAAASESMGVFKELGAAKAKEDRPAGLHLSPLSSDNGRLFLDLGNPYEHPRVRLCILWNSPFAPPTMKR